MNEIPAKVKPFHCLGVNVKQANDREWIGDCPFCDKEKHFSITVKTGQYQCFSCAEIGNAITFLTKYTDQIHKETAPAAWRALTSDRGLPSGVFKERRLGFDGKQWLIPCFSEKGTVRDVRRYDGKRVMSTFGCKTQLFGADRIAKMKGKKGIVWICEGEWDAFALDWALRESCRNWDVVVAVPGASIFKDEWSKLLTDKNVIACYDNDDPGDKGAEKAYKKLKKVSKSIRFINWPNTRPKGYDLRDFILEAMEDGDGDLVIGKLIDIADSKPRRIKEDQIEEVEEYEERDPNDPNISTIDNADLEPIEFNEAVTVFKRNYEMTPDMVDALKVFFAVCLSTDIKSDPLWLQYVGPPGAGKTMLLQALAGSERCIFRSTITAHSLVSGWKEDKDSSLIPKLSKKCFILKDYTEVLSLPEPQKDEIYSTLRGAYDGSVVRSYGNNQNRKYDKTSDPKFERFSMIAGVTHAIHGEQQASLGERFLRLQMGTIDAKTLRDIQDAALDSIGFELEKEDAVQLASAQFLKRTITKDDLPDLVGSYRTRLHALVELIGYMRAHVERDRFLWDDYKYRPVPEVGTRLVKQLGTLAMCIAVVDRKTEIDDEVYHLVERVAMDTAYGFHLDIINAMMLESGEGVSKRQIAERVNLSTATIKRRFDDLVLLKMVKSLGKMKKDGQGNNPVFFKVTDHVANLWRESKGEAPKITSVKRK